VGDNLNSVALACELSLPLVIVFSVLGIPLLLFQRRIVRSSFPFLRRGYLAVILYGPAVLALIYLQGGQGYLLWSALYELVAFVATITFVPLAIWFGALTEDHPTT